MSREATDVITHAERTRDTASPLDPRLHRMAERAAAIATERSDVGPGRGAHSIAVRAYLKGLQNTYDYPPHGPGNDELAPYALAFDAWSYDFGSVPVGGSRDLIAVLTNTGTTAVTFRAGSPFASSIVAPYAFNVTASTCAASLAPASSCIVTVTFSPQIAGSPWGYLLAEVNESSDEAFADLYGTGQTAESYALSFDAASYEFGSVPVGQSEDIGVTLTNTGTGTVTFANDSPFASSIVAPDAFNVTASTCGGSLVPASSCAVTVTFSPQIAGSPWGYLVAAVNESSDEAFADLYGTGVISEVIFGDGFDD